MLIVRMRMMSLTSMLLAWEVKLKSVNVIMTPANNTFIISVWILDFWYLTKCLTWRLGIENHWKLFPSIVTLYTNFFSLIKKLQFLREFREIISWDHYDAPSTLHRSVTKFHVGSQGSRYLWTMDFPWTNVQWALRNDVVIRHYTLLL